jgi:hypothetical protein
MFELSNLWSSLCCRANDMVDEVNHEKRWGDRRRGERWERRDYPEGFSPSFLFLKLLWNDEIRIANYFMTVFCVCVLCFRVWVVWMAKAKTSFRRNVVVRKKEECVFLCHHFVVIWLWAPQAVYGLQMSSGHRTYTVTKSLSQHLSRRHTDHNVNIHHTIISGHLLGLPVKTTHFCTVTLWHSFHH